MDDKPPTLTRRQFSIRLVLGAMIAVALVSAAIRRYEITLFLLLILTHLSAMAGPIAILVLSIIFAPSVDNRLSPSSSLPVRIALWVWLLSVAMVVLEWTLFAILFSPR